ncbi:MAG: transcriptional regulator, partial [Bacteroidetes bacterium]
MQDIKVFISSVQGEFANERQMLYEYLKDDALLKLFFEPFIFENTSANAHNTTDIYLGEISKSDIYIGLFGKEYGYEDKNGISPTEHEFDRATELDKTRLIFISNHNDDERHSKVAALIRKAEQEIVRKKFTDIIDLKTSVYSSLIYYLGENDFIRTGPFDAAICKPANFDDIDVDKVVRFAEIAKSNRKFPLSPKSPAKDILAHLKLLHNSQISNAAILLFGKVPQKFLINSVVKCAQFYGNIVEKPIPSYQIFKGDVFQLIDQAVGFVLSRIDAKTGARETSAAVKVTYEIPIPVVTEAIVNAVAHRNYTGNGSIQVMLFRDRLEIWNPGQLPTELTLQQLRMPHGSFPTNPLLSDPMYFAGYVEQVGSGTIDIIRLCKESGLRNPEFVQDGVFKTIIWRKIKDNTYPTGQVTGQVTGQATGQVDVLKEAIKRVVMVCDGELKRSEIQDALQLKHREYFAEHYLIPAVYQGYIELKYPDNPNHPQQKYKLTNKGESYKLQLVPLYPNHEKT